MISNLATAAALIKAGDEDTARELLLVSRFSPDEVNHFIQDAKAGALAVSEEVKPKVAAFDPLPKVPALMKAKPQWVRWRLETVNGRPTKVPYQVNGSKASSSDPSTWTDYSTAITGATVSSGQGVGFMFADGFAGIDLDGCLDPKTGDIKPWADDIIQSLDNAYVEISPSGTGLHIFVRGKAPGADKKFNLNPAIGINGKATIEIYDERRYFTVTGNPFFEDAGDVVACDLSEVYKKFHDLRRDNPAQVEERADSGEVGEPVKIEKFGLLGTSKLDIFTKGEIESRQPFAISNRLGRLTYPSQSEADLAFATILALKHGGDAEKVDEAYRQSSLMRDKWLRDDYRDATIKRACETAARLKTMEAEKESNEKLQPTHDLEVRNHAESQDNSSALTIPRSCLASSYLGDLYDKVFAPNDWPLEMALPALVTAASVVIPQPSHDGSIILLRGDMKTSLYTALIAPVHSGKSQVIEWAAKSLGIYHDTRDKHYTQIKFGSAEQMWKYLFKHSAMNDQQDPKAFQRAVLVNPDELSHVMAKAGIPDATLASTLTTAYYNRRHSITLGGQGGGRDITIPFPFSIIGGIVQEDFDSVFDASTLGGLYDRFLFGLAPEGFNWSYRSFPVDHPFFQSKPSPVVTVADPSLEAVIKDWNNRDRELGRIVEVCARVAAVFAAIDGHSKVMGSDLEKLWPLAQYQKSIRAMYKPNPGMNPDAIYANVAMNWIHQHAQQWRTLRDLQKGTNYHRRKLGPNVAFRSVQALARDGQIDLWISTADAGGNPNSVPRDYTGKRPKIGGMLIRLAGSQSD